MFTYGKCASNPKKNDLQMHEKTSQHLSVLQMMGLPHTRSAATFRGQILTCIIRCDMTSKLNSYLCLADMKLLLCAECFLSLCAFHRPRSDNNKDAKHQRKRNKSNRAAEANSFEDDQSENSVGVHKPVQRKIKAHWFLDFPWLEYSQEEERFFCKQCR